MARELSPLFSWRGAVAGADLPGPVKCTAYALSLHMSERGDSCFPSVLTLSVETGFSERTVQRALQQLTVEGWIVATTRQGRTTEYRAEIPEHRPAARLRVVEHSTSQRVQLRVFRRDGFRCRYCGDFSDALTVDHVDPDGADDMGNYATACVGCNARKGRRTPESAGMVLRPDRSDVLRHPRRSVTPGTSDVATSVAPSAGTPSESHPRSSNRESDKEDVKHPPRTPRAEATDVDPGFLRFRAAYPKRAGGYSWPEAERNWRTLLRRKAATADLLVDRAHAYRAYCDAAERTGTEFVMQPSSFLGPKKQGWREPWETLVGRPAANGNGRREDPVAKARRLREQYEREEERR